MDRPTRIDREGRSWVRLSDDEPIVVRLDRHAEKARCETSAMERFRSFAEIELVCERSCRAVKSPVYRGASIELVCAYETVSVIQLRDMVGFRCSSLPAQACEHLVRSLSNGRPDSLNALGGPRWGI